MSKNTKNTRRVVVTVPATEWTRVEVLAFHFKVPLGVIVAQLMSIALETAKNDALAQRIFDRNATPPPPPVKLRVVPPPSQKLN